MLRTILAILFLLCSLFTIMPIPARQLWYLGIAVPEFPWVWLAGTFILLVWSLIARRREIINAALCMLAMILFSLPIWGAIRLGNGLDSRLRAAFGNKIDSMPGPHRSMAYRASQMISGIGAGQAPYHRYQFTGVSGSNLTLNYYPSALPGTRPLLLVAHGGSWKRGTNAELPDVNTYFARAGYNVATINYRLAPEYKSPAPQEDLKAALAWMRARTMALHLDPSNIVLLGRSAGGQIVLTAAYSMHDPGIRGVISFYGPVDMMFAYNDPHNTLVLDPKKVMPDFFGGTPAEVPDAYLQGSPIRYVTPESVPTLLVHGELDQHVHIAESKFLDAKLNEAGVPHMLLALPWATHGCEYSLNGPSGQLSVYAVERFLAAVTAKR